MRYAGIGCLLTAIALVLSACGADDEQAGEAGESRSEPPATSESPSTSSTATPLPVATNTPAAATVDQPDAAATTASPSTTSETVPAATTEPPEKATEEPPTVDPDDDGSVGDPGAAVPPGFESLVATARADLAKKLDVDASQIMLSLAESIVWPDAGLGCPQPGMAYAQVQVDGYRILLTESGTLYAYHGGGDRPQPFFCPKPTFP